VIPVPPQKSERVDECRRAASELNDIRAGMKLWFYVKYDFHVG
jgi:hypothetical protein